MHVQGTLPRLPCLRIATVDQGCGIPKHQLASIFDPFFTTKSSEKGSGLGLYNARLFAEKHRGAISVDSIEQKGTTVAFWLPEADFTESNAPMKRPHPRRTLLLFGTPGGALDGNGKMPAREWFFSLSHLQTRMPGASCGGGDYTAAGVLLLVSSTAPLTNAWWKPRASLLFPSG